jgi:protein-S-isoprenylcysteine O-methyltransferase Ste14
MLPMLHKALRTCELPALSPRPPRTPPRGAKGGADGRSRFAVVTARARFNAAADHIPLPAETLAGVVAAILTQRVWPLRLPAWAGPAGLVVAGGGLAVVLAAWRERGPGSLEEPEALVTTGLHGVSRNPIYLGCTAVHLGLAGATRNGWMLATCPVSAALVHRWVLREERWLRERFGDEYHAYQAQVPRYL